MADTKPTTPAQYLKSLPEDRRKALAAVRKVINANLPEGYKEGMQYGMIGWFVPHSIHPAGYHCDPKQPVPFIGLGNQKNHMALYMFCIYTDAKLSDWFVKAWTKTGIKLDMGKSCIRFKSIDGVPLEVVGEAVSRVPVDAFLKGYLSSVPAARSASTKAATKKAAMNKASGKKAASKKVTKKTTTSKKTTKKAAASRVRRA
ncbi:MAG: DUF1801 domain-containing protein [Planctomycetota bacterium]